MNRDEGLAAAFFAVVIGGAVALTIANEITAPACTAARAAINGAKDFDFGCLEFWLNRYQGLIGNIVTAGVAGVTLIWVARQLVPANQQAGIAATVALRTVVKEFREHSEAITKLRDEADMVRLIREVAPKAGVPGLRWHESRLMRGAEDIGVACRQLIEIAGKNRSPIVIAAAETAMRDFLELDYNVGVLNEVVPSEDEIEPIAAQDAEALIRACRDLIDQIDDQFEKARTRIDSETQAAWVTIRDLEHKAIGPWWRRKQS